MCSVLISVALSVSMLAAMPANSRWSDDYGYSLKMSRAVKRPLLIVLDKPEEEKQRVKPVRFSLDPTQAGLLRPYELCHVDVTSPYGKKLAKAFGAKKFPYTAIVDKSGEAIIYQKSGRFRSDEWASVLTTHRDGNRKVRTVSRRITVDDDCFT